MLGKFGILIAILTLVLLFYVVISFGAGAFKKEGVKPETRRYIKSVNILLLVVWLAFFLMIYIFNDAFIEWCKTLVA